MQDRHKPFVCIVTPVYNGERYLKECIESVIAQTYPYWEYVIVNNQSTDNTAQIAESYAARDSRIKVHHNERFLNLAENWNHSVKQVSTKSKYCKIVHADDWIFPECIEKMVALAERHSSVGIVTSYIQEGDYVGGDGIPFPSQVLPGRQVCRDSLMGDVPYLFGSPSALLIRSDLMHSRERFYNSCYHQLLDQSACYELLKETDLGFVHQVLTFHRMHEGSQTAENEQMYKLFPEQIQFLKEYGPFFLTKNELERRIEMRLSRYYKFLGRAKLERKSDEFWKFHRQRLQQLGYPLQRRRLNYSYVRELYKYVGDFFSFPLKTMRNTFLKHNKI